jgi:hypothetical protein
MSGSGGSAGGPERSRVDVDHVSALRQALLSAPGERARRRREAGGALGARTALGPLVAGLAVAGWVACFRSYGIFDFADEGAQLMQGLRAASGERPYVDFATGYGPLHFAVQGALVAAGGLEAVRLALVVVHGVAAAMLYAGVRRLVGAAGSAVTVLVAVAFFLPMAPQQGAPFLVPYPAWWVEAAALACIVLLDRRYGPPSRVQAAAVGALAGAAFAMKPNSGLLLAAGSVAALVLGPRPIDASGAPRVAGGGAGAGPIGSAFLLLFAVGALALVLPPATSTLWWAVVPPALALAALGRRCGVPDAEAAPCIVALGAAFAAVALTCFAPSFVRLGPAAFVREALLVGAGVAEVYAVPFPTPALVGAAAGGLAFVGRTRPAFALALLALALAAATGGGATDAPTAAATVRVAAERVIAVAVPLVLWGGLVALQRTQDPALVAPVAIAVTAALQLHPRPDFLHLMSVGPVLLPLAAYVVRDVAAHVAGAHAARALGAAVAALALARLAPGIETASAIARGAVETVRVGSVPLVVEPSAAPRLRALGAAVDAVGARSDAAARIATFPGCAIVPFLAGRRGAGPHDYFFPGRPTRTEGAALAAAWRAAPPPLAVTCDAAGTDLAAAWTAYPELVTLFAERYRPVLSAPPFVVHETRR